MPLTRPVASPNRPMDIKTEKKAVSIHSLYSCLYTIICLTINSQCTPLSGVDKNRNADPAVAQPTFLIASVNFLIMVPWKQNLNCILSFNRRVIS